MVSINMDDKSTLEESENKNSDKKSLENEQMTVEEKEDASRQTDNTKESEVTNEHDVEPRADPIDVSGLSEKDSAVSASKSQDATEPASQPQQDVESETEVKGWLQKRTKGLLGMSCKWERQWFQLKGTDLLYGESQQVSHIIPGLCRLFGIEVYTSYDNTNA